MLNAIVDASLRYKVLVLVAFAVLIGLGVMAYRQVPVDAFPNRKDLAAHCERVIRASHSLAVS